MTSQSGAGFTVGELVTLPGTFDVLAGHGGLDNAVSWAYVGDSERPWDWVDPGDLVLTSGWIIPDEPQEQADWVDQLARAGMSGLVVGDESCCKPISDLMLQEATRRSFPVIRAHHETSWATIIRAVARANQSRDGRVLSAIMQVHDVVRIGLLTFRTCLQFMADLKKVVGCDLYVVDPTTWEPVLPRTHAPPPSWGQALEKALAERGGPPPLSIRLEGEEGVVIALPIPSNRQAFLFVDVSSGATPRLTLLQHVSAACALEIAHVEALFDKEWRTGSALLSDTLQGRLEPTAFIASVGEIGLELPCVCVAVDAPLETVDRIDRYWAVRRIPHLVTPVGPVHLLLVAAEEARLQELRMLSEKASFRAGISEPLHSPSALGDASRQARWALETLRPAAPGVAHYGNEGQSFLPRTLLESEHAVERILGPLIEYDAEHDGELVKTLRTYFDCDRSPKRAAAALFVHNQTVNYRLSRVQELTGRSLRSTADISELWLALRALALTQTAPVGK